MPDDQTLAMILAICDLMRQNGSGAETAIAAYKRAMKEVLAALQRINRSWAGIGLRHIKFAGSCSL